MIKYKCAKCEFSGYFQSERKKCPSCGKQSLYIPVEEVEKKEESPNKKTPKKRIFFENKWNDDGRLFADERELTKKLNEANTPSPRTRKNHIKTANCSRCGKEFKKFAGEYLCQNCSMGK